MNFFDIMKAFLPLVLLLGLLYALLRFVRRRGFNLNSKSSSPLQINVLNTKMIMPKKYLSVVKVDDKLLVLGLSENSISLLKEFDDKSKPEEEQEAVPNTFLELFKKNIGIR